jgi:hypothetical protein
MAEEGARGQPPKPVPPEAFAEARRAVAAEWAPRVAMILLPIAAGALAGYVFFDFSATRVLTILGLGLDICGVWMLAGGALMKPEELAHVGTWGWVGRGTKATAVKNRAEGIAGVWLAVAGFALQLIGNFFLAEWRHA